MELVQAASPQIQEDSSLVGTLRMGAGQPLVLLHGVTGSSKIWRRLMPLLAPFRDVIAPTALGHRGGLSALEHPLRIRHVVDDAQRILDRLGLDRAHLAGNSMGGWVALELARRGRALSVCALSPAGAWTAEDRGRASNVLRSAVSATRRSKALIPWLSFSAMFRRWALRDTAVRGHLVSREEMLEIIADLLGCDACDDLLETTEELLPLQASCPITLAWAGEDRLFPAAINGARARSLLPGAKFELLEGVGHVPMLDDPQLVADVILRASETVAN
jgi:pimeloyl-ACP methyl ester carboxylesterase